MNLVEVSAMTEDESREYLEGIRWPDGAVCAHCGSQNVAKLQGKATRPGVYKCRDCRKQFTVTVGTIMHRSHISIRQWVLAYHLLCSSKKGFSALQLQRELGLESYQSAWHLAHRIRHTMTEEPMQSLLSGTVEVDETYVGGKPRNKGYSLRGKGTKKTPVVALVERNGNVRSRVVRRVDSRTLHGAINECVEKSARLITDENPSYNGIGQDYDGGHDTVCHSRREYARGDVNTNTIESHFALIKRGHYGVYHSMSKKHLQRYCTEFAFRWNYRKVTDGERREAALRQIEGKRLMYREPASDRQS